MNKKCLVTGSAGFIGSNLSAKLINEGYEIICVDNFNEYYDVNLKKARVSSLINAPSQVINLDLRDADKFDSLVKEFKPEVICHLAAQAGVRYSLDNPHSYIDNNITATINVLEAAKQNHVKDFIFASTSSVYGLSEDMPFSEKENINSTISTYSSTKRACELLCHTYSHLYGTRIRILRFFTVYGPWGRPDMALFLFTKSILENRPIKVYNNGNMKRDFTYIDDIVDGFISSIGIQSNFEIINLGCGKSVDLLYFINVLENTLQLEANKEFLPIQPGDVPETFADISKAKKLLNYNPKVTIEEGIPKFVDWYMNFYRNFD